jgi:glycerophosphoryl diester phosphodiesterase
MAIVATLAFQRLFFSNQLSPWLARIQWNHGAIPSVGGSRDVIGHRGSARFFDFGVPIGNTPSAIRNGIDSGADWIEIDIRVTSDRKLVVFHDETIDQKTNGEGEVSEITLEKLQAVEVLVTPTERILTLDQVFKRFNAPGQKWVFDVKDKDAHQQLIPWLEDRLAGGGLLRDRVVVMGEFEIISAYAGKDLALGYTVLFSGTGNLQRVLFRQSQIISRCREIGCTHLVVPIIFASQSLVYAAREAQLTVWVYGSEDELDVQYSVARGIGGIIVDNPAKAMRALSRD